MLKTRIVGVLIIKSGGVVQSIGFKRYLPVASLDVSIDYLNKWGIDEIVILDIDASSEKRSFDYHKLKNASVYSQTPIAVGGGISTLSHIENMIKHGADKVVINTAFLENPKIIQEGAQVFGNQSIIVSIDLIKEKEGFYTVFNRNIKGNYNKNPIEVAKIAENLGAGELLINSVDNDGMKIGYDLDMLKAIKEAVSIPVIICGGVGRTSHMGEGIKSNADAVAAGNFFHFTELSVVASKRKLIIDGHNINQSTYTNFDNVLFNIDDDRPMRYSDEFYDKSRFDYIPEEVI